MFYNNNNNNGGNDHHYHENTHDDIHDALMADDDDEGVIRKITIPSNTDNNVETFDNNSGGEHNHEAHNVESNTNKEQKMDEKNTKITKLSDLDDDGFYLLSQVEGIFPWGITTIRKTFQKYGIPYTQPLKLKYYRGYAIRAVLETLTAEVAPTQAEQQV